jgi:hypothetical protein
MTTYAKLTENNDNEGETWRFWIPVDGNQAALEHLDSAIGDSEWYDLDLTPVPESDVDALVRHTGDGYMAYDTKLAGVLALTAEIIAQIEDAGDEGNDPLYKGGIKSLMVVAA